MAFIFDQPQIEMAIEVNPKAVSHVEEAVSGRSQARFQPHDTVPAYIGKLRSFAPNARRAK
jgi:hypothetical protein